MSFSFSRNYLKESRIDRSEGDDNTFYNALIKGHSSQYGTIVGSQEHTFTKGSYITFAYDYEVDEDEKEWLKILLVRGNKDFDWSIEEDWIPTDILEKRPLTVKELEEGINPVHWLNSINKIWRKTDDDR